MKTPKMDNSEVYFLQKDPKSLERITAEAIPKPSEGYTALFNPIFWGQYVKEGSIIREVDDLAEGQKEFEFPDEYFVFRQCQEIY